MEKQFVCVAEASRILGIDARTLKKVLQGNRQITYKRVGHKLLINKQKLMDYLNNSN